MRNLVPFLPVLGCLAMAAAMWVMMRGQHSGAAHTADPATQEEINRLKVDIALLKQDQQPQPGSAVDSVAKPRPRP